MFDRYAFVSHASAIEANRMIDQGSLASLPDLDVAVLPVPELCVTNQKQFKELETMVSPEVLTALTLLSRPVNLLVPSAAARSRSAQTRFHVWADVLPDKALIRVDERVFISSPSFAVLQLALAPRPTSLTRQRVHEGAMEDARIRRELDMKPRETTECDLLAWEGIKGMVEALCALMEFAGTYRLPCPGEDDVAYGLPACMSCSQLAEFVASMPSLRGTVRAKRIAELALDGSASPMETALALLLTLPVEMGGYGLPRPVLNMRIAVDKEHREVAAQSEMYADMCWPHGNLVLEYNSTEFHSARGDRKAGADAERSNALVAMGYRVLSVTYGQVSEVGRLDLLARQIAHILGVELPSPSDLQRVWRTRLHALLLPQVSRMG